MRRNIAIMARLIALVKPLASVMLLTITAGIAGYLCAIFITVLGGMILLNIIGLQSFGSEMLIAGIIGCAVFRGILRYIEQLSGHYIAFKVLAVLRDHVFSAMRRLTPAKLESKDKGNLIALITSDIELLEVFYAHTIAPVCIAVVTSVIMTAFIAEHHYVLGGIAAAGYLTVGLLIPLVTSRKSNEKGLEYRNDFGILSSYFLDSLRGIQESIQFNQENKRLEVMDRITNRLDSRLKDLKCHEGLTRAVTDAAILLFSSAVLFTGIGFKQAGVISFESVILTSIAMISSFGPVVAISNLSNNLLQTLASGDRVLELLDEAPQVEDVKTGKTVDFKGALCRDVTFGYTDETVLNRVTLDILENQIIGIGGKSGSGKSTLMKLIMRFWDVKEGQVEISGENIKAINTKKLRELEGYMTQETYLFNDTIETNIKLGNPKATASQVEEAARKASVHDFIMSLPQGYQTKVGELGDKLSGGERQRIGLARSFLHDPPLLLLDEPTSNLDSLNEAIILKSLQKVKKERTVMIVSHRASAIRIADQVYYMKSGRMS